MPRRLQQDRKGRSRAAHTQQAPQQEPDTPEVRHGTNDNPPELEQGLKDLLGQWDFGDTGYVQQSNNNTFVRMKMFDSEVTVDGNVFPCKVLVQFQIPRQAMQAEEVAA